MTFAISAEVIDPETLKARLAAARAGACVSFEGWVRDHNDGEPVTALEYETHAELAVKEGEKVLAEACARFDIALAACVHRVGLLKIGECAVWVGASAEHRGAAFDACRYIIDEIKQRLPIWKKEHYANGASAWVNCATPAAPAPARLSAANQTP
ncbi:MAG TPA: molybdenum cofactor biosynthesis protein MoaE [Gammaproteobacteria bacterium]|jgi:molybdopterin synthase catalytic subunit